MSCVLGQEFKSGGECECSAWIRLLGEDFFFCRQQSRIRSRGVCRRRFKLLGWSYPCPIDLICVCFSIGIPLVIKVFYTLSQSITNAKGHPWLALEIHQRGAHTYSVIPVLVSPPPSSLVNSCRKKRRKANGHRAREY